MTRMLLMALLSASVMGCANMQRPGPGAAAAPSSNYERQILLTIPQDGAAAMALTGDPSRRYLRRRAYGPPPSIDRTLDELARQHGIERIDGWSIASLDVYCEVFEVPETLEVERVIGSLRNDPRVDLVQRMNMFDTLTDGYDDPYADLQPSVSQLGIEQAHQLATGKGVTVAVIDSAIDASHPELFGHIEISRNLVPASREAAKGEIHGTAVAGVIASTANNKEGIVGVAPDVKLAALRACWSVDPTRSAARCSSFSLALALELALTLRPAVINLSLGGPRDPLLGRLLAEAVRRGIVIVVAEPAASSAAAFPASEPDVIVARAMGRTGDAHPLALAAPASEILTTVPNAGYAFFSGSSLAAAHVSGVIALLMERDSSMDARRIATLLADTTSYSAAGVSINACGALETLTNVHICAAPVGVASY